jgi:hypothetical protein
MYLDDAFVEIPAFAIGVLVDDVHSLSTDELLQAYDECVCFV